MSRKFKPQDSDMSETGNLKSSNSEEEDNGSWILDLIDLSGLENWLENIAIEAKEMLKRMLKPFLRLIWIWKGPTW